ncbi:GCC2 and GCC3 domain containing protein, partial [Entamoeba invadens IP1]
MDLYASRFTIGLFFVVFCVNLELVNGCELSQYFEDRICKRCLRDYYCPNGILMYPCLLGTHCDYDAIECTPCQDGYYSTTTTLVTDCLPCPSGTYSYGENKSSCTPCPEGTYSVGGSGTCTQCTNEACANCDAQTGECTSCQPGYKYIVSMLTPAECEQCEAGYYSTGGKYLCSKCPSLTYSVMGSSQCIPCRNECKLCDQTNGKCTSCYTGSYLESGECIHCLAGTYLSGNSCVSCKEGYYSFENSTQCSPCNSICLDCDKINGKCTLCNDGQILQEGNCVICQEGTYHNKASNCCVDCPIGTFSSTKGETTCTICGEGKYTSNSGSTICYDCDISCITCYAITGHCTSCKYGQIIRSSKCVSCEAGTRANQTTNTCEYCPAGTYSNSASSECYPCEEHTYSSTNSSKCYECGSSCEKCEKTNGNCLECKYGMWLNLNGNCLFCSPGTYAVDSKCETCADMTFQNVSGQVSCIQCDSSCFSCVKTTGKCILCKAGYELTTDGKCIICKEGTYSVSTNSTCIKCPEKCDKCVKETGVCTSCISGFKEIAHGVITECVQCSSNGNCLTCDTNEVESLKVCVECINGYYLENNMCNLCSNITNCEKCSTTQKECLMCSNDLVTSVNECAFCEESKVKIDYKTCIECYKKISNCQTCAYNNGNQICIKCFSPYVVENNLCVLAYSKTTHFNVENRTKEDNLKGCLAQVNSSCYLCNENNTLNNNKCVERDGNCLAYSIKSCDMCVNMVMTTNGNCSIKSECKYQFTQNEKTSCLIYSNTTELGLPVQNCKYTQNEFCYLANDNYYTTVDRKGQTQSCTNSRICQNIFETLYDFSCEFNFVLDLSSTCFKDENCLVMEASNCVLCLSNYHIENGICVTNKENCLKQNKERCLSCKNTLLVDENCLPSNSIECQEFNNNQCHTCEDNYYKNVSGCVKKEGKYENCDYISVVKDSCIQCNTSYLLVNDNCELENVQNKTIASLHLIYKNTEFNDNCIDRSPAGCHRCSDGFYISNMKCIKCEYPCTSCYNLTYCTKCDKYSYSKNGICIQINDLIGVCEILMSTHDGCIVCKDGYMRSPDGKQCEKCDESCLTCYNEGSCITCNETYYRHQI